MLKYFDHAGREQVYAKPVSAFETYETSVTNDGAVLDLGYLGSDAGVSSQTLALQQQNSLKRLKTREGYYRPNQLYEGAVHVRLSYLVDDSLEYGELLDGDAQLALQEWWEHNNLAELITERLALESLIDGELALVRNMAERNLRDMPGTWAIANSHHITKVEGNSFDGATELSLRTNSSSSETYEQNDFVWYANKANFGMYRGSPALYGAFLAAEEYLKLLNHRIRQHDIQARINMIVTHLLYSGATKDLKTIKAEKQEAKKGKLSVPKDGGVLHIYKDAETGESEEVSFTKSPGGANDGEKDADLVRMTFNIAAGVNDIIMGNASTTANRATAQQLVDSILRLYALDQQKIIRRPITKAFQKELINRFGPDKLYKVAENTDGKRKRFTRVPANRLTLPLVLPDLQTNSTDELVKAAVLALDAAEENMHVRKQVLEKLGYDSSQLDAEQNTQTTRKRRRREIKPSNEEES